MKRVRDVIKMAYNRLFFKAYLNSATLELQIRIVRKRTTSEEGDLGLLRKTSAYSETIRNEHTYNSLKAFSHYMSIQF